MYSDKDIMLELIKHAKRASERSEVPVACIISKDGEILSKTHNLKERHKTAICHAEMLAIREASEKLRRWRLNDCKIYVNLEPCLMCLGAIIEARIGELFFSVYDYNMGGINGRYGIGEEKLKLTNLKVNSGLLCEESKALIQSFFENKRKRSSFSSGIS